MGKKFFPGIVVMVWGLLAVSSVGGQEVTLPPAASDVPALPSAVPAQIAADMPESKPPVLSEPSAAASLQTHTDAGSPASQGDITQLREDFSRELTSLRQEFHNELAEFRRQLQQKQAELEKTQNQLRLVQRELTVLKQRGGQGPASALKAQDTKIYEVPVGDSPALGPQDAKITIVEFADFQCPYTVKEYPMLKKVMKAYPNEVRVVFKHFPLSFHPQARPAHAAAEFALRQGGAEHFWMMHDLIIDEPEELELDDLREHLEEIGLDVKRFDQMMDDWPAMNATLQKDIDLGRQCNVTGTPTIFINGLKLYDRSMAGYQKRIQEILRTPQPDNNLEENDAKGTSNDLGNNRQ